MDQELSKNQIHKLKHMLGYDAKKCRGYRNRYCIFSINIEDMAELDDLVKKGFCKKDFSDNRNNSTMIFYSATEDGCKAIKLTEAEIKRAMEK